MPKLSFKIWDSNGMNLQPATETHCTVWCRFFLLWPNHERQIKSCCLLPKNLHFSQVWGIIFSLYGRTMRQLAFLPFLSIWYPLTPFLLVQSAYLSFTRRWSNCETSIFDTLTRMDPWKNLLRQMVSLEIQIARNMWHYYAKQSNLFLHDVVFTVHMMFV